MSIAGKIEAVIKDILNGWVLTNLDTMFGDVNDKVGTIGIEVAKTPSVWNNAIFQLMKQLSQDVMLPVAGIIMAYVFVHSAYEMNNKRNSMTNISQNQINTWLFSLILSFFLVVHAFDFVNGILTIGQWIVTNSSFLISENTQIDVKQALQELLETKLESMSAGELLGLGIETALLSTGMKIIGVIITVILHGRMIQIFNFIAVAPLPMATFGDSKLEGIGYNYVLSIVALALQGFFIMVCVGIYCVLIQSITVTDNISTTLWNVLAYTVLLCFTLLKTESWANKICNR